MRLHHSSGMKPLAVILYLWAATTATAQTPSLGSADSFVILARTGIVDNSSGATTVTGSVGCPAGVPESITPRPGDRFVKEPIVQRALRDSAALYDDLASRTCTETSHVHCSMTLTFSGTRDDFWFIKIDGPLDLASGTTMTLAGGALSSHIFWIVNGSVTLGADTTFAGNLLARGDITFGRGVTLAGRALSQGTITIDDDAINLCGKLVAPGSMPPALPPGPFGCAYPPPAIVPSGGDPPYRIEVIGDDHGVLAGAPKGAGTFDFGIRATDSLGAVGIRFYSVTIYPSIVPPPQPLPDAQVCDFYNVAFQPSGGSGQYEVLLTGLPKELSQPTTSTLAITGIPRAAGDSLINAKITDIASGCSITTSYTLHVGCDVSISATLPEGKVCQTYNGSVKPSCAGSFVATKVAGMLPPGLEPLPENGVISGTPTMSGTYPFTVEIKHASGCVTRGDFTITIKPEDPPPPIVIDGTVCIPLNVPIACTIIDPLPPDLRFDDHMLHGTPKTKVDQFVSATCAGCPQEQSYEIRIACPKTILSDGLPKTLPFYKPVELVICRQDLKECFPCTIDPATLPPGLVPFDGGVIMGQPDTLGKYHIKVTAVDAQGSCPLNDTYCLEIVDPPLCEPSIAIAPPSRTFFGTVGVALPPLVFTAAGGTAPYAYDIPVPTLPPGLSLSLAGVLTGTPTTAGRFNFAVRATDAAGTLGCPQVYSLEIGN